MFRHKNTSTTKHSNTKTQDKSDLENSNKKEQAINKDEEIKEESKKVKEEETSEDNIKELLEKNLKWSQIIYEQNRRLNHKLIWATVAGWLRLLLIVAPLILAFFYFSPFIKQAWKSYNSILGITSQSTTDTQVDSLDNLFKVFNLNKAQQEQVKSILK